MELEAPFLRKLANGGTPNQVVHEAYGSARLDGDTTGDQLGGCVFGAVDRPVLERRGVPDCQGPSSDGHESEQSRAVSADAAQTRGYEARGVDLRPACPNEGFDPEGGSARAFGNLACRTCLELGCEHRVLELLVARRAPPNRTSSRLQLPKGSPDSY